MIKRVVRKDRKDKKEPLVSIHDIYTFRSDGRDIVNRDKITKAEKIEVRNKT